MVSSYPIIPYMENGVGCVLAVKNMDSGVDLGVDWVWKSVNK